MPRKESGTPKCCSKPDGPAVYDPILIVMEENKEDSEIIGHPAAPYINDVLAKEGASFTQMFGEEHYSQGNYFWFFSGENHTFGFRDVIPNAENKPFTAPNLRSQLIEKGLTFKGHTENLPEIGFFHRRLAGILCQKTHAVD